jgi:transcriptional regulator GlxA family with amidase domain
MHGMAMSLIASMVRPNEAQALFVEYMALAFHAHAATVYGGAPNGHSSHGGLAPWQLTRACDVMEADLGESHSISCLAGECGLSSSHFARAFKETTGLAPHQWLTRRRVQRARELLAQSTMELTDIALACGFVDQSHFSRVFARTEKQSPGRWRRQLSP